MAETGIPTSPSGPRVRLDGPHSEADNDGGRHMHLTTDQDVITVTGEVDTDHGYDMYVAVIDAAQAGAAKITLDLSAVTFLDSVGLGMLVRCRDDLPRYYESAIELRNPSEPVKRLLDLTALTRQFRMT